MATEEIEEKEVRECIQLLGLSVQKLEDRSKKTPDFLVKCDRHSYLVELKTKFDDQKVQEAFEKALSSGEIVQEIYSTGREKKISKVIWSACKQLVISEINTDFKLIWLHAKGHHPDFQMYDFESTLYGHEVIVDWGQKDGFSGFCYHYGHSDFYNYRDVLDGAVVSTLNAMQLCLNICSPRYSLFRKSRFVEVFGEGVLDPIELERTGDALIVDSDVDRNNESDVIKYLIDKYNLKKAMKMPMQQVSASIMLPDKGKI